RGVEFHYVVRVVVREQHGAVAASDDAIGVIALPRPDDLPVLSGGDHTGYRGRRGRWRRLWRRRVAVRRWCAREGEGLRTVLALVHDALKSWILPRLQAAATRKGGRGTLSGDHHCRAAEKYGESEC